MSNSNDIELHETHLTAPDNATIRTALEVDDFPEGGKDANLVVLGSLLGLLITFGIMNSVGVIQAYVATHQLETASTTSVGWVFSIYFFVSFIGSILTGPYFDAKGAKSSMIIGSLLMVGGLFATANCNTIYQFLLAFGFGFGMGSSFVMTATLGSVSHWFNKRRALALGGCTIGGSLGGVIWPLMFRSLFPMIGFQWSLRLMGLISLICLGISTYLLKVRLPAVKSENFIKDSFVMMDLIHEPRFLTLSAAILLGEFSLILVFTYMPSYTMYHGYSESDAFLVTITCNCVGLIGRSLPSYAGDHFGRFNVMCISVVACTILIFIIWLPFGSNLKIMYTFAAFYGLFNSTFQALTPVCCGQISKTKDFGKRYGTVYFFVSFGNLIALPVGGALIGNGKGYNNLIILAGVTEALSAILWIISRVISTGWKLNKF